MVQGLGLFSSLTAVVLLTVSLLRPMQQGDAQDSVPATEDGSISHLVDLGLAVGQYPSGSASVALERRTWAPGALENGQTHDGVSIDYVLAGSVSLQVYSGAVRFQRAASDGTPAAMESIAKPIEAAPEMPGVEINPGDLVVHPPNTSWLGKNNGTEEVVILSIVIDTIYSRSNFGHEGVTVERLGTIEDEDWEQTSDLPLAVSLRRATLSPGDALTPYPVSPAAPELLAVESGVMEVRDYLADGTDLGAVAVVRGQLAPVPYWDQASRSIRAGSEPAADASGARPSGSEPLVFLSLSVGLRPAASAPPTSTAAESGSTVYRADAAGGFSAWYADWPLVDGMLVNDGAGDSVIFAPHDLGSTVDYAVEAEIRMTGTAAAIDARFGLVVRGGDPSVDARGLMRPAEGKAMLLFGPEILVEIDFDPGDAWHTYRIEIRGNVVRLLVDGQILLEATDDRLRAETGGRIGLRDAGAPIEVRRFEVIVL